MKFKSKKIQCALISLTLLLVCATSAFALPTLYEYNESYMGSYHIHEERHMSSNELENFLAEHNKETAIFLPSLKNAEYSINKTTGEIQVNVQQSSEHSHTFVMQCVGNHEYLGNCQYKCTLWGTCNCGSTAYMYDYFYAHAWFGQTCTRCGATQ